MMIADVAVYVIVRLIPIKRVQDIFLRNPLYLRWNNFCFGTVDFS